MNGISDQTIKEIETIERSRMLVFLGRNWFHLTVAAWLFLQPWFNQRYVPRDEYNNDRKEWKVSVETLNTLMVKVNTQMMVRDASSVDKEQSERIGDHEARIRLLERMKTQ